MVIFCSKLKVMILDGRSSHKKGSTLRLVHFEKSLAKPVLVYGANFKLFYLSTKVQSWNSYLILLYAISHLKSSKLSIQILVI